ncbi:MAG: hypothetical protein QNJ30_01070 [Kiloniellales bacterium]|nr:hypothetical protein [Kiloniellales bacterium]
MTDGRRDDPVWATLAAFRKYRADIGHGWEAFLRERLLGWALRWTIGFFGIFLVTYFYPDFAWLWWAGAGLALFSLALLLGGQWLISRKLAQAEASLDDLETTLEELEAEGLLTDGESRPET